MFKRMNVCICVYGCWPNVLAKEEGKVVNCCCCCILNECRKSEYGINVVVGMHKGI